MPFKEFEFTKASDIIQEQNNQVQQMLQGADPRSGHSQALVNAITNIFNPKIKKAAETEAVIKDAMSLEREEGEDFIDFQLRQQRAIMEGAAGSDPNVAVQASQNMSTLMAEKNERNLLEEKNSREREKHRFEVRKNQLELTPIIEKLNPETGQFEAEREGEYGVDTFESFKEQMEALQAADPQGKYRMNKAANLYEIEEAEDEYAGRIKLSSKTARDTISGYESITEGIDSFAPLVNLLERNPFALQGVQFDKNGNMEQSTVNKVFGQLTNIGQQFRQVLDAGNDALEGMMFDKGRNEWVSTDDYVDNALKDGKVLKALASRGIDAGIARGIIVDLGYALAKMRDEGRLSDQDVSLAIRSLTGMGGVAEIADLLAVQMRKQETKLRTLDNRISQSPGYVSDATILAARKSLAAGFSYVDRLRATADQELMPTGRVDDPTGVELTPERENELGTELF